MNALALAIQSADGNTELTTTGALLVACRYRPLLSPPPLLRPHPEQADVRDRFDVADVAELPRPDSVVDLVVTSPPYALDLNDLRGGYPKTLLAGPLAELGAGAAAQQVGLPVHGSGGCSTPAAV